MLTFYCHLEQRDCLHPLVGRIFLSKIRFFVKEAQNDRNVIARSEATWRSETYTIILSNAIAYDPLREGSVFMESDSSQKRLRMTGTSSRGAKLLLSS